MPRRLKPVSPGAARSELFALLARGHYGVRLSRPDWNTLACWIDLLVPYCGDYLEANAWSETERSYYAKYADKRRRMAETERANALAWSLTVPGSGAR